VRDLLGTEAPDWQSWNIGSCLDALAEAGAGVVVLLAWQESDDAVLESVDIALGQYSRDDRAAAAGSAYQTVGIGSQILRDLGVGKIRLMGAPIKYNAISGFDLEVTEFVSPTGG
jgi:3,4-dihydroxy 2-butanone 4-phosphate synthase/GTP cyclohydrolase II